MKISQFGYRVEILVKKPLFFGVFVLLMFSLLSACGKVDEQSQGNNVIKLEYLNNAYYFEYPFGAVVQQNKAKGVVIIEGCTVGFSPIDDELENSLVSYENSEKISDNVQGLDRTMFFDNGIEVFSMVFDVKKDFAFYLKKPFTENEECQRLQMQIAGSFTDQLIFVSSKYNYSLSIPKEYKIEYLPEEKGVILKKWIETVTDFYGKPQKEGYRVTLQVTVVPNDLNFSSLEDYISRVYSGYSMDFLSIADRPVISVFEQVADESVNHFFMEGSDNNYYFDVSLIVLNRYYNEHSELLSEFLKNNIKFFE